MLWPLVSSFEVVRMAKVGGLEAAIGAGVVKVAVAESGTAVKAETAAVVVPLEVVVSGPARAGSNHNNIFIRNNSSTRSSSSSSSTLHTSSSSSRHSSTYSNHGTSISSRSISSPGMGTIPTPICTMFGPLRPVMKP